MFEGTTIVAVQRDGRMAMAGDGQVTHQQIIMKQGARKVRRLYHGRILAGFAGSVADAVTLFSHFERKLDETHGNLPRAVVDLAKEWRTDKILRRLEALLLVADNEHLFIVSGGGEVIEPDEMLAAIGSGGGYALAAAKALLRHTDLVAGEIARESLAIAASICVYTNDTITVETL